jgi:hypothetical protein
MKLFYAFLAVAAATETTVATTTETTLANVTETTAADVVVTTAADVVVTTAAANTEDDGDDHDDDEGEGEDEGPDCAGAKEFIDRAIKGLEDAELKEMAKEMEKDVWTFLEDYCNEICTQERNETCASFSSAISCEKAQEELTATSNDVEKVDKQTACEKACADFKDETCGKKETFSGFLANGLSFVLFAILAIFKY